MFSPWISATKRQSWDKLVHQCLEWLGDLRQFGREGSVALEVFAVARVYRIPGILSKSYLLMSNPTFCSPPQTARWKERRCPRACSRPPRFTNQSFFEVINVPTSEYRFSCLTCISVLLSLKRANLFLPILLRLTWTCIYRQWSFGLMATWGLAARLTDQSSASPGLLAEQTSSSDEAPRK